MITSALKSVPLAILLAFPAVALSSGDEPAGKEKEKKVTIALADGEIYTSDGDDVVVRAFPHARRGYLGVRLLEMTPELREHFGAPRDEGVLVASVESESPAAKAGIQVGDILRKADGERIESPSDLTRTVRRLKGGDTLKLDLSRDRAAKQIAVKIEERRSQELDLGELGREIGRSFGRRTWTFPDVQTFQLPPEKVEKFQRKLEDLEKRLNDLEKKFAR
jgi:membrane-associated protease RseP (regulator of RpoE activity)